MCNILHIYVQHIIDCGWGNFDSRFVNSFLPRAQTHTFIRVNIIKHTIQEVHCLVCIFYNSLYHYTCPSNRAPDTSIVPSAAFRRLRLHCNYLLHTLSRRLVCNIIIWSYTHETILYRYTYRPLHCAVKRTRCRVLCTPISSNNSNIHGNKHQ